MSARLSRHFLTGYARGRLSLLGKIKLFILRPQLRSIAAELRVLADDPKECAEFLRDLAGLLDLESSPQGLPRAKRADPDLDRLMTEDQ